MPMRWAILVTLASSACASVAGSMRDKAGDVSHFGHAQFDSKASELTSNWFADTYCCGPGEPEQFRQELTDSFNRLLEGGGAAPARYRARVTLTRSAVLGFFPCLGLLMLFGCPAASESAKVELEIDIAGRRFAGTGESSRLEFLYYWPSSIGDALGDALRNAREQR